MIETKARISEVKKSQIPVVIFAGGMGTRFSEETELKPKPLITIGEIPIIFHVMSIYSKYGYNDFIVCLGYKANEVKSWFLEYSQTRHDFQLNLASNRIDVLRESGTNWTIKFIDTGLNTNTAGRLRKIRKYIEADYFLLTYADGLGNIDIDELIDQHLNSNKLVTMTTTNPIGRFGYARIENGEVTQFDEKVSLDNLQINSGFFVVSTQVFNLYKLEDTESWEVGVLEKLTKENQLAAYEHKGFWKPMDTLRDKRELEELIAEGSPPWLSTKE